MKGKMYIGYWFLIGIICLAVFDFVTVYRRFPAMYGWMDAEPQEITFLEFLRTPDGVIWLGTLLVNSVPYCILIPLARVLLNIGRGGHSFFERVSAMVGFVLNGLVMALGLFTVFTLFVRYSLIYRR